MILLDTHIWFIYINDGPEKLSPAANKAIGDHDVLGVSIISCWEIAMLVAKQRIRFGIDVEDWISQALAYKGFRLVELTPEITTLSTRLPGAFHKDPADRMIVATCLKLGVPLLTLDRDIIAWGHIQTVS